MKNFLFVEFRIQFHHVDLRFSFRLTLVFLHLIGLFFFGAFAQEVSDNVDGQRENNGGIFLCRY
jgi:hypothetical protein